MKRKIAAVLTVLLYSVFILAGCAKQEPAKEDDLIVIGMSQVGAESDWRQADTASMKSVFTEANGYRLLFEDARQEQENQFVAIRRFIQQKVDYIVVMPITEDGWDAVLKEAKDAGIPVIVVDRMVNVKDENLVTAHVGSDFYAEGRKATDWMKQKYAGAEQVSIIHIQGTKDSTAQIGRTAALDDAVKASPNWKVIARMDGDFTEAKTYEVMKEYLSNRESLPKIDVVYCENDNAARTEFQSYHLTRLIMRWSIARRVSLLLPWNAILFLVLLLSQSSGRWKREKSLRRTAMLKRRHSAPKTLRKSFLPQENTDLRCSRVP